MQVFLSCKSAKIILQIFLNDFPKTFWAKISKNCFESLILDTSYTCYCLGNPSQLYLHQTELPTSLHVSRLHIVLLYRTLYVLCFTRIQYTAIRWIRESLTCLNRYFFIFFDACRQVEEGSQMYIDVPCP